MTRTAVAFLRDAVIAAPVTAMHPMGRVGTPEEVAAAVLWRCSDAASFVTGQALALDGGRLALSRRLAKPLLVHRPA